MYKYNDESEVRKKMAMGTTYIGKQKRLTSMVALSAMLFLIITLGAFAAPQSALAGAPAYTITEGTTTDPGDFSPAPSSTANVINTFDTTNANSCTANALDITFGGTFDNNDIALVEIWDGTQLCTVTPTATGTLACTAADFPVATDYEIRINLSATTNAGNTITAYISGGAGSCTPSSTDAAGTILTMQAGAASPPSEVSGSTVTGTTSGAYVVSNYTITSVFNDNGAAVTSCEYTVNDSNWFAANDTGSGASSQCQITGVTCSDTDSLTIRMRSTNSGGTTTQAATADWTCDGAAPTGLGALGATPGNNTVALSWGSVADTGSGLPGSPYNLRRETSPTPATCSSPVILGPTALTSHNDNTAANGTTYNYIICVEDNLGFVASAANSATPSAGGSAPSEVSGSTVTGTTSGAYVVSNYTITSVFNDNGAAVTSCEYTVNDSNWFAANDTGSGAASQCQITGVTCSDTDSLTIRMRSTNGIGTTTQAAAANWTCDGAAPTGLGALGAASGDNTVALSWGSVADTGSGLPGNPYNLRRETSPTPATCSSPVILGPTNATAHNDNTAANGTTYNYIICAEDNLGFVASAANSATPSAGGNTYVVDDCTDCHGMGPTDGTRGTNGMFLGSHGQLAHVDATPIAAECAVCHLNTVAALDHRDGTIDMKAAGGIMGGTYSGGSPTQTDSPSLGTCSSVSCHGVGTPTWGGSVTCTSCHNNTTDDGSLENAAPSTGTHDLHMANNWGVPINCENCHGGSANTGGHAGHQNGSPDNALGYVAATTNCTNTCHDSDIAGDWTAGNLGADSCQDCHSAGKSVSVGWPPTTGSTAHTAHVNNTDYVSANCVDCHNDNTSTHSTIDGTATVPTLGPEVSVYTAANGTCTNTCHDGAADFRDSAPSPTCIDCHDAGKSVSVGWPPTTGSTAHTAHVANTTFVSANCVDCHNDNTSTHSALDTVATAPTLGPEVSVYTAANGTCTNTCHGGSADFRDAAPSPVCTDCHSSTKSLDKGWPPAAVGAHTVHVNNTNYVVANCLDCHNNNTVTHSVLNNVATSPTGGAKISAYTAVSGTCTNTCHGGIADFSDSAPSPLCIDCHAASSGYIADAAGAAPASGLHNLANAQKHDDTFKGGSNDCTECHTTPPGTHMDGSFTADGPANGADRFVSRASMTFTEGAVNADTCSGAGLASANCHVDGGDWSRLWSTQADSNVTTPGDTRCNVCHGQYSAITGSLGWRTGVGHADDALYGATMHEDTASPTCDNCHAFSDAAYDWATNHSNTKITMNDNGTSWARSGTSGCSACHDGAGGDGIHDFTASLLASETVTGAAITAGDCVACHTGIADGTGTQYVTRDIIDGDFANSSRHVFGTTPTLWDCVVCHMEGDMGSGSASGDHDMSGAQKTVVLRDVDTGNQVATVGSISAWDKTLLPNDDMQTYMDNFCMACHDSNGATAAYVNATNDGMNTGGRALTPFNTNDCLDGASSTNCGSNQYFGDTLERTAVLDVKSQFNPGSGGSGTGYDGSYSQHAVRGARYSVLPFLCNLGTDTGFDKANECTGAGYVWSDPVCDATSAYGNQSACEGNPEGTGIWQAAGWGTAAFVNITLKNGTNLQTVRETATLHCADCHTIDSGAGGGAHGGANPYMLTASTVDGNCWTCHAQATYSVTGATGSRVDHSAMDSNVWGTNGLNGGSKYEPTASAGSPVGMCLNCHGGNPADDGYGSIHGITRTTSDSRSTQLPYRFLGGTYMTYQWDSGFEDATGDNGACYTNSSLPTDVALCTKHTGSAGTGESAGFQRDLRY